MYGPSEALQIDSYVYIIPSHLYGQYSLHIHFHCSYTLVRSFLGDILLWPAGVTNCYDVKQFVMGI
jgi:hypothetical protein